MKILCYTPLHPEYGIKQATLDSIMALEHDDVLDRVLSTNDNPHGTPFENVTRQHNKARDMALYGDYDALLSVEADMIVPPDTISRLIDCNADISYGLYVWRFRPQRWNVYTEIGLWGGRSVNHYPHEGRAAWGKIVDTAGLGMGCTLICRNVLQNLRFRIYDGTHSWLNDVYGEQFDHLEIDQARAHPMMICDDWFLALDAEHYGFSQRANMGVVCGHIKDDIALWPDPVSDEMYRLENV